MKTKIFIFIAILSFFCFKATTCKAQENSYEEVFTIVENMPSTKNCLNLKNEKDKRKCTTEAITKYIGENIVYPEDAKNKGAEGIVYVSYIVNKEGKVENVEVLRGIEDHKSLDKEAVRVVQNLPQFIPGTQREKKVNVRYSLPIKFSL